MTPEEQIAEWVKGNSIHNPTRNECCPDFSCCVPELLADEATRKAFQAHPEQRYQMLGMFLAGAFKSAAPEKTVYVAGVDHPEDERH